MALRYCTPKTVDLRAGLRLFLWVCVVAIPCFAQTNSDSDAVPGTKAEAVQQAWDLKKRYFLAVAVSKYTPSGGADLPFAEVDEQKVKQFFTEAGYEDLGSLSGIDATHDNFILALKQIQTKAENSRVVVYYSGHGVLDAQGKDVWLQMYGQPALGDHFGLSVSELVDTARGGSYLGELTILLDACFSGQGILTSGLTLKDLGPSTSIFTSSTDIQESHKIKVDESTEMSAFTYSLFHAISPDWDRVDPSHSGFIGYKELHLYSIKELKVWNKQGRVAGLMHPLLLSNDEMVFTYDRNQDKEGFSPYRDYILGDGLADSLAPTAKMTAVDESQTVALRYPIPSARARTFAAAIAHPRNDYVAGLKATAEGKFSSAEHYLTRALVSRIEADRVQRALAWNHLYSGDYTGAVSFYEKALALARSAKPALLLETANALQLSAKPKEALIVYSQAIHNGDAHSKAFDAVVLNNAGTAYAAIGDNKSAREAFDSSLKISSQDSSQALDVATTSANLAIISQSEGHSAEAETLSAQAENIRSAKEITTGDYSTWKLSHSADKSSVSKAGKPAKKAASKSSTSGKKP